MIGTGFHFEPRGLFVTAKHVIEDVFENGRFVPGKQVAPIAILQMYSQSGLVGPDGFGMRPITHCWLGEPADIALGTAAQLVQNETGEEMPDPRTLRLSWNMPKAGDDVQTFAFPNATFSPRAAIGFGPRSRLRTLQRHCRSGPNSQPLTSCQAQPQREPD